MLMKKMNFITGPLKGNIICSHNFASIYSLCTFLLVLDLIVIAIFIIHDTENLQTNHWSWKYLFKSMVFMLFILFDKRWQPARVHIIPLFFLGSLMGIFISEYTFYFLIKFHDVRLKVNYLFYTAYSGVWLLRRLVEKIKKLVFDGRFILQVEITRAMNYTDTRVFTCFFIYI